MIGIGDKIKCNPALNKKMECYGWWEIHKNDVMTVCYISEPDEYGRHTMKVLENGFVWNTDWMLRGDIEIDVLIDLLDKEDFEL